MEKKLKVAHRLRYYLIKDSCGCAMGARFLFVGLILSIPYYVLTYKQQAIGGTSAVMHTFIFIFILSGLGKITGIVLYRMINGNLSNK